MYGIGSCSERIVCLDDIQDHAQPIGVSSPLRNRRRHAPTSWSGKTHVRPTGYVVTGATGSPIAVRYAISQTLTRQLAANSTYHHGRALTSSTFAMPSRLSRFSSTLKIPRSPDAAIRRSTVWITSGTLDAAMLRMQVLLPNGHGCIRSR